MKKITFLLAITLATSTFAQQFPLQSQYQFNYSSINPAAVGQNDYYSTRLSFRQQWIGLTDNPISTQLFSVNKAFGKDGVGITVFNDQTGGAFNKSGIAASYSHKVPFSNSDLYFGVSVGTATINLENIEDPAIFNNSDMIAEATFGAYYIQNNWKIGVSVPGLLNSNIELTNSNENTLYSHLYSMIAYKYDINQDWTVHPSVFMKTTSNHNQFDVNLNFKLKNKLWFGSSYRQDFGPTIYVGVNLGRLLSIYSHDISTNEVAAYSNGSHEFTIGYDFIPEEDMEKEETKDKDITDNDKDMDGVEDNDDLCPDVPGEINANGCPDFDKDGVPDDYDLCPHLYGSKENQGCPELTNEEIEILAKALGDLKFGFDKDIIEYSSYNTLTNLTVLMHKNPDMYLLIEGHSSDEGSEQYNLSLSARRAKAVQNFFTEKGLEKNRMVLDFYGEENPKNKNYTETDKAENRRVEFEIRYHFYEQEVANKIKEDYDNLLNNILDVNEEIIKTIEEELIEEELEEIEPITEDKNPKRELAENEQIVDKFRVNFDSIIFENPINNDIEQEKISINEGEDATDEEYLVVIHVLNSVEKAIDFVYDSGVKCNYKSMNGKYYIYVYSSPYIGDVTQFRNAYNGESWVKKPTK